MSAILRERNTVLEDLPDEILLEICSYLSPLDILYSFDQLNSRLRCTIQEFHSQQDLSSCSWQEFYRLACPMFVRSFAEGLNKLTLSNETCPGQIRLFEQSLGPETIHERFIQLKSLKLIEFANDNIHLLAKIFELEELDLEFNSHESLTEENQSWMNSYIFGSGNRLKKVTITIDQGMEIREQEQINEQLEDLTIQLISLNDLLILFRLAPSLRHLEVDLLRNNPLVSIPDQNLHVHLKELYLHTREREILPLSSFLQPLIAHLPFLEYLSLGIKTSDPTYTDANSWCRLFHSHPSLQRLILGLEVDLLDSLLSFHHLIDFDDLPETILQNFSTHFPLFPICIYKNFQTLFLDSVPYRFSRDQSYNTSPFAVHAVHTDRKVSEERPQRIVGLSMNGEHLPIELTDYIQIINRFVHIQWLYLDSIHIPHLSSSPTNLVRLKRLRSLIYMRSTQCQIHRELFQQLFCEHRRLRTLKIMYGDLISFLRRCQPPLNGEHIQNLLLYLGGADGRLRRKHLFYLVQTFPSLKHLTVEVTSNNLIKKYQQEILTDFLLSFPTLRSFRIISRKGNLSFVNSLLQDHQFKQHWLQDVNAQQSSLILQPKYFALWKN